jgi:co-chaperonin GroES (HSP10)
MRSIKDNFFISADPDVNKKLDINGPDGKPLFIDIDFNPYAYSTRIGIITHVPEILDDKWDNDNPLKVGDTVMFHHHVVQEENKIKIKLNGKYIYKANYGQIFAKIEDNDVIPLETVMYVEAIQEKEEALFCSKFKVKEHTEEVNNVGIVRYLSQQAEAAGLQKGDKIFYTDYANYKTDVFGHNFYRIRLRNIRLIERNNKLLFLDDVVILENDNSVYGLGDNITDLAIGNKVHYYQGAFSKVTYRGKQLISIKRANVNLIIKYNKMIILNSEKQNRVLLKQAPVNNMEGGILIPDSVSKKPMQGSVVEVSECYIHDKIGKVTARLKKGDEVLYEKGSGNEVTIHGKDYILLLEGNIYAIV